VFHLFFTRSGRGIVALSREQLFRRFDEKEGGTRVRCLHPTMSDDFKISCEFSIFISAPLSVERTCHAASFRRS